MSWEICCVHMCRACMKVDGVLLPMYDDDTMSNKNLLDKLSELASIQIDRFDGLPNMLCAKCAYRTDVFYDFKQQVQATDKKLKKMFENQPVKEEALDDKYNGNNDMDMDESIEVNVLSDNRSIHCIDTMGDLHIGMKCETDNGQDAINISQLIRNEEDNDKSSSHLDSDLLSNLQETSVDRTDTHSIKSEISEDISKIFESQPLDYTIMYIPECMINSISEPTIEDSFASHQEQEEVENSNDIFISEEAILDKQQNIEILNDICVSNITQSKVIKRNKRVCWMRQNDNSRQNEDTEINKDSRNIKHLPRTKNSDDSDSDYFIDPKDNILGSLNDTITRIKEVKREGNTIEYQCTLCLQNYNQLTGVLLHTIDNHIPSSGPFFCVVCEKDCESHRELRAHAKTHTGRLPYSCFICNKAYTMKRYLKRHMACHTEFPRYRCPKCGDRFKIKSELESHVTTHVHGAPYACSQCPRMFNHKGNYKRHLITHLDPQGLHLPKYPCNICGKRFLNNRTLETHTRVHTGEKPFKCEVCDKSFSQQGNLLNHARIHSNPRSYTCEVCGKRFNQRATLRDHSLLHTGEKPYVCNVCGIAFTFSAALRRHMWTHAVDKPFGCDTCGARFVGKYDLRRHMRVHTDRPKAKRKRNVMLKSGDIIQEESKEKNPIVEPDTETVLIQQVLLPQDVTQVGHQVESEKENVDALFNLIQYG